MNVLFSNFVFLEKKLGREKLLLIKVTLMVILIYNGEFKLSVLMLQD